MNEKSNIQFAENLPYWKTSRGADNALREAKNSITKAGGEIIGEAFIRSGIQSVFILRFSLHGYQFRFTEAVKPSESGNDFAAKVQAAVSLKHSVKARVNEALRKGARNAFFNYWLIDGKNTPSEMSHSELTAYIPLVLQSNSTDGFEKSIIIHEDQQI